MIDHTISGKRIPGQSLVIVLALTGALFLGSCNLLFPPEFGENVTIHAVSPSVAQPGANDEFGKHYAGVDMSRELRRKLVVFLPGTAGSTENYRRLSSVVMDKGYHLISLAYPNTTAVGSIAQNDLEAYGLIRQEICTGVDTGPSVSVDTVNSVVNRLSRLLSHLAVAYGDEGWGDFSALGQPAWERITLSGYSQGAGHAAWIASQHAVDRVVMFSGVVDGRISDPRESAVWIEAFETWQTTPKDFRFFVSIRDGFYPAIETNLRTLGLEPDRGHAVSADFYGSALSVAQVYTTAVVLGQQAHPSTCEDSATPVRLDGVPLYRDVWDKLFD